MVDLLRWQTGTDGVGKLLRLLLYGLVDWWVLQVVELEWDDVHGWAGMGGTRIGTTR